MPGLHWRDRILATWWQRRWRGYQALHRLLPSGPHGDALLYVTPYGSRFILDPSSYIDGRVVAEGFYESEVLEALRAQLVPGAVLWDVGANFGLHAATAARLAPATIVVAFEPNPAEHARLLRHRALNAPQLLTSSFALSDRSGILPLHLGPPGNSGMTTLVPWSAASYSGTVLVATARGDDLIARRLLPAPTLIKLDVEGHEAAVLRGMHETLRDQRCAAVVFEDSPAHETETKSILRQAGFAITPLARHEDTAHALVNFVARKSAAP